MQPVFKRYKLAVKVLIEEQTKNCSPSQHLSLIQQNKISLLSRITQEPINTIMAIKRAAFFTILAISIILVSSTVTQYDKAALTCIADYKTCVLGKTSACRTCTKSCGNVSVSTAQPKDEICTLLQTYCQY